VARNAPANTASDPAVAPVQERAADPNAVAANAAPTAPEGPAERVYLGPASVLRDGPGGAIFRPGDPVSLREEQYAQLTRLGHSFDPPWLPPAPRELGTEDDDTELTV
jgi:hypothetical protein